MSNNRPFPWTAPLPDTGRYPSGDSCADGMRVQRFMVENFGSGDATQYPKIPRTFGAKVCWIGPTSEVDSVLLLGSAVGPLTVSVGVPCFIPLDVDITVVPSRIASFTSAPRVARLDLMVANKLPGMWPLSRSPRVYPDRNSPALNSTTEVEIFLKTEFRNGASQPVTTELPVMGAKSVAIYMRNPVANSNCSWRLYGLRGNCLRAFPISPSGYLDAAPTYNTLPAGAHESYHMDLVENSFEYLIMAAKAGAGSTDIITVGCEVRDDF